MCAWQVGTVSHFVIQRQGQGPKAVRHHHHRHHRNQHHHQNDDDVQNANLNGSRVGCTWFWQLAEGQAASQNSTWSHNFVFIQKLMEEKSMQIWILIFIYIFLAEGHSASQNSSCIFKILFFYLLKTVVDMSGMPEWLIQIQMHYK